jgi:putative endonuclease
VTRSRSYRDAQRHGKLAEMLCALLLRLKGYRILARHWRSPVGELDIVARRGRTIAVVEVKARDRLGTATESLGPRQRRRIGRAAGLFLAAHPDCQDCRLRFDLMLVLPWRPPVHVANAWHEDR